MNIGVIPATEEYSEITVKTTSFGVEDKRDYVTIFSESDDVVNVGIAYKYIDELIGLLEAAKVTIEHELDELDDLL